MLLVEDASKEELKPDQISISLASDPLSEQSALASEAEHPPLTPNIEVTSCDSGVSAGTGESTKGTSTDKTECDQRATNKGVKTPMARSRSPSPKPSKRSPKKGASDSVEGKSVCRGASLQIDIISLMTICYSICLHLYFCIL